MRADLIERLRAELRRQFENGDLDHYAEFDDYDAVSGNPDIGKIVDALASQEPVAWQDMSTAPKDGSRFLAYTEDGGVDFFRWQDHGTCAPVGWRDSFILVYREGDEKGPRGWMPVPSTASPVVPVAAKAEAEPYQAIDEYIASRREIPHPHEATISQLQAEIARMREAWEPLVQQAAHVEVGMQYPVDVQGATKELIRIISGFDALMSARATLGGSNDKG